MHCYKIKLTSGKERWVCVADAPFDPATGKRQQITRRGKSKKEAKAAVEEVINALEDDVNIRDGKKLSFGQVADEWFSNYKIEGNKKSTLQMKIYTIGILKEYYAKMPIGNITHSNYQRLINQVSDKYSRNTVSAVNVTAGQIFKYAIRDRLI
ncbi:Arm DNA-binding domain-containing protein [Lysinibacillus sp. 54212]|uniref:Arm DNA-binding domain-containing protein n=1 Tax=Lysinibacillus sp. 54212 TaxID=3119829 RepID=UPI002FC616DD